MDVRTLAARLRTAWRGLTRGRELDRDMDEEMRFHLEREAERIAREQGVALAEARRRAAVAFGGVEKYKEAGRDTRGVRWLDALSLDARLAVRMLIKYPGLTVVGGLALAVAVAIGATSFEIIAQALSPAFPMADGDRLVSIVYLTENPGNPERRLTNDFHQWRGSIASIEQLSAFDGVDHNLASGEGPPEPIHVAEMTASGFLAARTPPLLGRYLLADDERPGAPPVMVIGYDAWQARFAGDPAIVGRTVTLGGVAHTVVGVMPEGFRFPVNHQYWTPLVADPSQWGRLEGPRIFVFGRLKPGVTQDEAQAELATITARNAADDPRAYGRLRLTVLPYARERADVDEPMVAWMLGLFQVLISMLVVVVSVNLAVLVYARTMARMNEISVRSALGASRRRILGQLFIEAAALSAVGTAIGLVIADAALEQLQLLVAPLEVVPFWINLDLSLRTIVYGVALAGLAAVIVGVLPGWKATGAALQASLREATAGSGGARLGRTWTLLIVTQVAIAVASLPLAVLIVWHVVRADMVEAGFPAGEFITAEIALDDESRFADRHRELMRRLEAEPGVLAVTFSAAIPGLAPAYRQLDFDGGPPVEGASRRHVAILQVAPEMLDVYGARPLAGRFFETADAARPVVIVNRTFVTRLMGARPVLGQRLRFARELDREGAQEPGEWRDIVGVVDDFPAFALEPGVEGEATLYYPAAVGGVHPATIGVRVPVSLQAGFIGRFREIGAEVDPTLQISRLMPLTEDYDRRRRFGRMLAWALGIVTSTVLLLSAAGIYALMSFTVAQRTREIGIRTALGAQPRRILVGVFGRALRQLVAGVIVGSALSAGILANTQLSAGRATALVVAVAAIILVVGVVAAAGPARRGLRIQAADVLRADV